MDVLSFIEWGGANLDRGKSGRGGANPDMLDQKEKKLEYWLNKSLIRLVDIFFLCCIGISFLDQLYLSEKGI